MGMGGDHNQPDGEATSGYTETRVDSDGHQQTKKVTKGDGWESVEITSDSPMDIGEMIGQIME